MNTFNSTAHLGPVPPELLHYLTEQINHLQADIDQRTQTLQNADQKVTESEAHLRRLRTEIPILTERKRQAFEHLESVRQLVATRMETNPHPDLTEAETKDLNTNAFFFNQVSHTLQQHTELVEYHERLIAWYKVQRTTLQRRQDILEWRREVLEAMADPASLTSFPLPPVVRACRKGHDEPVCVCSFEAAYYLLWGSVPTNLGKEILMFWPTRFEGCRAEVRGRFMWMAEGVRGVLRSMQ